jgi:undecaprenyl-diphosphatase
MGSILSFFLSYLLLYKYLAIFVITFSAGVILPLPVSALLLAVGAFSSQGYFDFSTSLLVAGGGNVCGDIFDYWLARRYRYAAIRWFRADRSRFFSQLEKYLKQNAGRTVFLTRFAASLDPVVSLLSGLTGVPFMKFLFFDAAGNFLEAIVILYLGYVVGTQWQKFSNLLTIFEGILFAGILLYILFRIYRRMSRRHSE